MFVRDWGLGTGDWGLEMKISLIASRKSEILSFIEKRHFVTLVTEFVDIVVM